MVVVVSAYTWESSSSRGYLPSRAAKREVNIT